MGSSKDNYSDLFDDDFEVTYEEDPGLTLDMYSNARKAGRARTSVGDTAPDTDYTDDGFDDFEDIDEDGDYEYEDDYEDRRHRRDRDGYYDEAEEDDRGTDRRRRRRSGGGVPLAAPIRKGGRLLSRLSSALLRQLSLILIIATAVYVTYTFWRASAPYGDIMESVRLRSITYTLAAYLSVAALFLLFEFISLIWAMTRVRVHNGKESWKEDTGRGLFSFIAVFTASYASFLFCSLLPDTPDIIYGLKGALTVYGSMHNVLLGLCAAGVISCLIRKYKSS